MLKTVKNSQWMLALTCFLKNKQKSCVNLKREVFRVVGAERRKQEVGVQVMVQWVTVREAAHTY